MKCEENYDIYEENLDIRAEEITKEKYKKYLTMTGYPPLQ